MKHYKSVEQFADAMQRKLNANSHKGGWGKSKVNLEYLIQRLSQEWSEWQQSGEKDPAELVDIANIAMMLYSRRQELYGCGKRCENRLHRIAEKVCKRRSTRHQKQRKEDLERWRTPQ